jgi:hypothetical protein
MINTEKSELHIKATRTVKDAVKLLFLLRRALSNVVTFCAFKKIRKPTTVEKRRRKQRSVCERKEIL